MTTDHHTYRRNQIFLFSLTLLIFSCAINYIAYNSPDFSLINYALIFGPIVSLAACVILGFILMQYENLRHTAEEKTKKLNDTLEQLAKNQEKLLHSEKLAALGGLVAGIAHELNTPIGNTMLATSTLKDDISKLKSAFESDLLKKSTLKEFVQSSQKAIALIQNNASNTATLVKNFKQVAVDQTSERRRTFDLKLALEEIIWVLTPQIKRTKYQINLSVPESLKLDSYPGALGQIISNLINNSIIHGFEGRENGTMTIEAKEVDGNLCITYSDDGCGISDDKLTNIFEPFYTTKLGEGGSGLGLHIVYNLITGLLGGHISVNSGKNQGVKFIIYLPLKAPEKSRR